MRPNDPWNRYRQIATQTAPPGQLVLMLFDGAIKFLERALQGFDLEDPAECNEAINNNIMRAQAIIEELDRSLNLAEGGEFSANMRRLYTYLDRRLMESNLRKEQGGLREVVDRLSVIRDAWRQMLQEVGQIAPTAPLALTAA